MDIKLQDINKKYGEHVIFNHLNLTIHSGEMVCIFGKSGTGKTTLLNILGLIEKQTGGKVFYDRQEIKSNKERNKLLKQNIGFIFQNFGLVDEETVEENLLLLPTLQNKKKRQKEEIMNQALNEVGLDGYLKKKVYECSGGEQQRVAIAKVLIKNSDVILADEPTASLDYENKHQILKMLRELNKKGKTIVLVSHDEEVKEFCSKVINI